VVDNVGMGKFLLLIPFLCAALPAQDNVNAIPRNDRALANAIAGIGKRRPQQPSQPVRISLPTEKTCSVPLQLMPIDDARQFASRPIPAPEVDAMPRVTVPAPPCESASF
jgi:hypothetical protein